MNRLTDVQKRMIVLGIGLLMVLFGVVQAVFKLDIFIKYRRVIDEVSFVLMMIAAVLLFSKNKPKPAPEAPKEAGEPAKIEEVVDDQTKEIK